MRVHRGFITPAGMFEVSKGERDGLVGWIDRALQDSEEGRFAADPGRVLIHRLSLTEYASGIGFRISFGLQASGFGFPTHASTRIPKTRLPNSSQP